MSMTMIHLGLTLALFLGISLAVAAVLAALVAGLTALEPATLRLTHPPARRPIRRE